MAKSAPPSRVPAVGRARRRSHGGWAARLFIAAACLVITSWSWQLGLVEVFEHHDELTQSCPDNDDKGPCDCGDNCHCCLLCAHQVAPAVEPAPVSFPSSFVAMLELDLLTEHAAPPAVEAPRVPKVPKHLS